MKSKAGIIILSILLAVLLVIAALLVNHIICRDGDANETLMKIDSKAVGIYNSMQNSAQKTRDYLKYLYLKITAIPILEYPADNLPLYPESRVLEYDFDEITNTINISSGTTDTFDAIIAKYSTMFTSELTVDYFKQYASENNYTAYGMIGNFTFLMEVVPSEHKKYEYEINTQLHYLVGDELEMENFFRQQLGSGSYLYSTPYIYMYQLAGDDQNIYLQLKDYKSSLLDIDIHVELYIDDEFYSSRYYGDTIRVPISLFYQMHDVKMIAFDSNNCVRAIDTMENTLCYDALGKTDFYEMASYYNKTKNLYLVNTDKIESIAYFQYFESLESLYFEGNDSIEDYLPLLNLSTLSELYLSDVNNIILYNMSQMDKLNVLQISDSQMDIELGINFENLSCKELIISNCPNLSFNEYGLFSLNLERLELNYNYSLKSIGFISAYPNLHTIEISNCDGLATLLNTSNLPNLNTLTIDNCQNFDLSQPLDNNSDLMRVTLINNLSLADHSEEYIKSIWANENLLSFIVANCENAQDINYNTDVWKAVN